MASLSNSLCYALGDQGQNSAYEALNEQLNRAIAENADSEVLESFLESGPDIDTQDNYGMTLLHHATLYHWNFDSQNQEVSFCFRIIDVSNSYRLLEFLIDHGADFNLQNFDGQTPLHTAASMKDLPMMRLLIKSGIDTTIKDRLGCTFWSRFQGDVYLHEEIQSLVDHFQNKRELVVVARAQNIIMREERSENRSLVSLVLSVISNHAQLILKT